MSHPDPNGPAATRPWRVGDELWNPVTRERAVLLETPLDNVVGRARAEMTALVGSRVLGEHLHPGLIERFTVLEGQLTVRRDGKTGKLREGETSEVRAGQWHDWWKAEDHDARVIVEVEPSERFAHMLETLFALATRPPWPAGDATVPGARRRSSPTRSEFGFAAAMRVLFAVIAPLGERGYGTYPKLFAACGRSTGSIRAAVSAAAGRDQTDMP